MYISKKGYGRWFFNIKEVHLPMILFSKRLKFLSINDMLTYILDQTIRNAYSSSENFF